MQWAQQVRQPQPLHSPDEDSCVYCSCYTKPRRIVVSVVLLDVKLKIFAFVEFFLINMRP
jgi:hypothetical protein